MSRKGKIYIILTTLAILSIVVIEYTKPPKVNWFPSYASHHKIPFGTIVFHDQLERLFGINNIVDVQHSPYEYLKDNDSINGTYVFINDNLSFGDAELDELLNWTSEGNTLFIASEQLSGNLHDTLNISTSVISNYDNLKNHYSLQLKNKTLQHDSLYTFNKANYLYYYKEIDTLNTRVIGVIDNASNEQFIETEHFNAIKQPFGKGTIILTTFPQAFTNYFLLTPSNQNYTSGLLSYINSSGSIYVDNHYKSGKVFYTSPLYVMLNNKALKWAYYIMLVGVFFYIIFEGKRKQRAIPIIKPLRNQTLDFTRTIANMYYEKEQHHEIVHHKTNHLLEYIRVHFHLQTVKIDDTFIKNLAARSNNSIEETNELFITIKQLNNNNQVSNDDLEYLNTLIEKFKSNNSWKKTMK